MKKQFLVLLFATILVITCFRSTDAGTMAHATILIYPDEVRLGKTPTRLNFQIVVDATGERAADDTIVITADTAIFKSSASGLEITLVSGFTGCTATGATDSNGKILTVTLVDVTNSCSVADSATMKFYLSTDIKANNGALVANKDSPSGTAAFLGNIKFTVETTGTNGAAGSAAQAASTETTYYTIGQIAPYYKKSQCGIQVAGTLQNCVESGSSLCKTCTAAGGFKVLSGTQSGATTSDPDVDVCTAGTQERCDALYFSDSAVDIYFTTNGNYGLAVCAAYSINAAVSDHSFLNDIVVDGVTGLISKKSILITKQDRYLDHVVSLVNLQPDTQYEITCHMDQRLKSTMLKVWTAPSIMLHDISLIPATTVTGIAPGLTLQFTHGADLEDDDTIVLTIQSGASGINVNPLALNAPTSMGTCTATTTTHAGITSSLTLQSSSASAAKTVTFTLGVGSGSAVVSTRGSHIIVTCPNDNMKINPAVDHYFTYDLVASSHEKVWNQEAWTVTNA
jgi:hypothetical protein